MFTASLEELQAMGKKLLQRCRGREVTERELEGLVELAYKSGKHDGWYERDDAQKKKAVKKIMDSIERGN